MCEQNVLIAALTDAVREEPLAGKILLTESRVAGHTLLRRLALAGTPWVNVRCETPLSLALSFVADELAVRGRTYADGTLTLLLVEELLAVVPDAVAYLASVSDRPGVLRAVHRSPSDLRLHGVGADGLRPDVFSDPRKGRALAALLTPYEEGLSGRGWADEADVFRLAAQARGPAAGAARYLIPRGLVLHGLARAFVASLPPDRVRPLDEDVPQGLSAPVSRVTFPAAVVPDPGGSAVAPGPLAALFNPGTDGVADVDLFVATGPAAEVREVLRRVAEAGVPFEEVEILLARETPYLRLLRDAAVRLDLPCTFGPVLPVAWTRPGRAALAYLSWVRDDFPVRILADALAAGDLAVSPDPESDRAPAPEGTSLSGTRAARILRRSGIGWGRDRYEPALRGALALLDHRGGDEEDATEAATEAAEGVTARRRDLGRVLAWVTDLLTLAPRPGGDGRVAVADLCRGLAAVLERYCPAASEADAEARTALIEQMRRAGQWATGRFPPPDAAERVLALVEDLRVAASGPRPGHLHVAGATSGGWAGRGHAFVVGLDEASFSGAAADPLLLDEERAALAVPLPTGTESAGEALYRFGRVLASLRGRVSFSYSLREPGRDRPSFPSPLLLQAYRLRSGRPAAGYADLERSLGEPAGVFPRPGGIAFDGDEAWLGLIASGPLPAEAREALLRAFPHLERGERLLEARASDAVTPYDGRIDPDPDRLDPRRNPDLVVSPTALEALGWCPLKYFFRYVLGVKPPDDLARDPGAWLDPLARGGLLHDVYRRFYERLGGRVSGDPGEESLLQAVCEEVLGEYRAKIPPPSEAVYERERREILASATVFLHTERRDAGAGLPRFFEVGFGFGPGSVPDGVPGSEDPVEIPVAGGGALRLRGRIDRIDWVGGHEYRVWDYKTGSSHLFQDGERLVRGRRLQHVLYAFAAERILRASGTDPAARVVGSGYRFPTPQGAGRTWEPADGARQAAPELLRRLLDLVAGGVFVAAEDAHACGWCDFGAACAGKDAANKDTLRKLAAGDPCLDALREVMGVA